MPDPAEVTKGISDVITKGLGLFGQGVNVVSQVLRHGDSAVKEMDGALTGGNPAPPAAAVALGQASEEQVAQQVASLVREAGGEATATGNPQAPGAVGKFQEAMRRLFQLQIPTTPESLADLVPTPIEMLRTGLKDFRGNMALVRLANGMGTLGDVQEVANYAEVVTGRIQALQVPVTAAAPAPLSPAAPPVETAPAARPTSRRRGKPQRRKKRSKGVLFAEAVASEVGNPQVQAWQEEYAYGDITEEAWVNRLATWAEAQGYDSLDEIYDKAAARVK